MLIPGVADYTNVHVTQPTIETMQRRGIGTKTLGALLREPAETVLKQGLWTFTRSPLAAVCVIERQTDTIVVIHLRLSDAHSIRWSDAEAAWKGRA